MMFRTLCIALFSVSAVMAVKFHSPPEFPGADCPACDPEDCPKSGEGCALGLVSDVCGCCPQGVCGLGVDEKCFNSSLPLPSAFRKYGLCADTLQCLERSDLTDLDEPETLCVCKEIQAACGSDNKTYDSVCHLSEEAARSSYSNKLYLKHWGPCNSVPLITSPPENSATVLHQSLALDCEVKGFPIPTIHWEFRGDNGAVRQLPSDDQYVAVQVRGGPEAFMATSWVQIVNLRPSDTGFYTCVATNSEGVARAGAHVAIRR